MKKIIDTNNAPGAIGPYSQAVKAGNLLFISGQLAIDPAKGVFLNKDITLQTRQSLQNLKAILDASGMSLNDVTMTKVYLSDMNNFTEMNNVYTEFFTSEFPARVAVEVARLPKDALVEIEAIACR